MADSLTGTATPAEDLVKLRQRINAARDQAAMTHKTIARQHQARDMAFAPFLDACAQDLEDLAQLCRSAADQAAGSNQI